MRYRLTIAYVILAIAMLTSALRAQTTDVPRIISYQGQIKTENNQPLSGNHRVTVAFYSDKEGSQLVWQGQYDVDVTGGVFNVLLGSGASPLPDARTMNQTLYVGTTIDNGPEMRPFSMLSGSPFAMTIPDKSVTKEKIAADYVGSITVNGKKITGNGTTLNLTNGENSWLTYDQGSGNLSVNSMHSNLNAKPQGTDGDWIVGGNAVASGTPILGTTGTSTVTDWQLIVGGNIAVRYLVADPPNILGGKSTNVIDNGVSSQPTIGAFIGGGGGYSSISLDHNWVRNAYGTIGGGSGNVAGGTQANNSFQTVGGGLGNQAIGDDAVVSGGEFGVATGDESVVGGGHTNSALGGASAVVGGYHNVAGNSPGSDTEPGIGIGAFVGGGAWLEDNTTTHDSVNNVANANNSAIVGGIRNTILVAGKNSAIGGGHTNTITDSNSAIPGGRNLTLGQASFGFSGQSSTSQTDLSSQSKIAAFNDVDVLIGNIDDSARTLRLYEPNSSFSYSGANFTSLKVGTQSQDIPYTLPLARGSKFSLMYLNDSTNTNQQMAWLPPGTVNTFLKSTGAGLVWDTVSGGGGGGHLYVWYDEDPDHSPTAGHGPVARGFAAIAHGQDVTTSGDYATIGGGEYNLIDSFARHSSIGGGGYNTIPRRLDHTSFNGTDSVHVTDSMEYSVISGGHFNQLRAPYGVICGGDSNLIDTNVYWGASYSFIGGGLKNTIDHESPYNVIVGGGYNYHNGYLSFIGGGSRDTIFDNSGWDVIGGGYANYIGNQTHTHEWPESIKYSVIGGGDTNSVSSSYSGIQSGLMNSIGSTSPFSSVVGGDSNVIASNAARSFVGGGHQNQINDLSSYSSIVGGESNVIAPLSAHSFIGGGRINADSASYGVIGGGFQNVISPDGAYSFIGGGDSNTVHSRDAIIVGGHLNFISSNSEYSSICGGLSNSDSSAMAGIFSGYTNHIFTNSEYSFIGGGTGSNISDTAAVIGGGISNTISDNGRYATISGGDSNRIRGVGGAVGGGFSNLIGKLDSAALSSADWGTIAGGYRNTLEAPSDQMCFSLSDQPEAPEFATIGGGALNQVSGHIATVIGGFKDSAFGEGSAILGGWNNKALDWQTVCGRFNRTHPSSTTLLLRNQSPFHLASSTTMLPPGNTALFIVGNGTDDSARSNAFEVSQNGHTTVFNVNFSGGATNDSTRNFNQPALLGGTYSDNVMLAWGDFEGFGSGTGGDTVYSDFGVSNIIRVKKGVYQVYLHIQNPDGGGNILHDFSVTATIVDTTSNPFLDGVCGTLTVSPVIGNMFLIRVYDSGGSCLPYDRRVMFKVCGRI